MRRLECPTGGDPVPERCPEEGELVAKNIFDNVRDPPSSQICISADRAVGSLMWGLSSNFEEPIDAMSQALKRMIIW